MDLIAVGAQLGVAAQTAARDLRRPTTRWWARIGSYRPSEYGRWVPTGCVLREQAEFYLEAVYLGQPVKEWRLL